MKAEVKYESTKALKWKTVDRAGSVATGKEKLAYAELAPHLHFLNWIEKDGFTVNQIINTKTGVVTAYWSFADEKSKRGKRKSKFVKGKFRFV